MTLKLNPELEDRLRTTRQDTRAVRNARLLALLDAFAQGDPEQQRQDLADLEAGMEAARAGQRRVFGEGFNP